jgi:imidazolonepropionase-like amidohydrolase
MKRVLALLLLLLLPAVLGAKPPQNGQPKPLVFTHVTVIDVTGAQPMPDMTVVVQGNRIAALGRAGKIHIPKGSRVVDAAGKYLIPGLWDLHVHLSWATVSALSVFISNGVTGVRDLGSDLGEIDSWRTRIDTGVLVGPRIVRAGPMLNGRSSNRWQLITVNPEQARGIVRTLKQVNVDLIKIHRRVPRDAYFAIMEEAKAQRLAVAGHIPMTVTPEEASDAGQLIEHTETLFEGTFSAGLSQADEPLLSQQLPDAIQNFRARGAESLFARFVRNNTFVSPILTPWRSIILREDGGLADPRLRYVARSLRDAASQAPALPSEHRALLARTCAELREVVRMMSRSGVSLVAGTDTSTAPALPGFFLHEELVALVEAGVTPLQALQAATLNPARAMKRENDLGSIATGKLADLVLLDANPLEDIRNTQKINAVVVNGRLLDRRALNDLLAKAEAAANRK